MIVDLGKISLDIDIEKTKHFYSLPQKPTDICDCDGCKNFIKGLDRLDKNIHEFFRHLGIDISKPAEMAVFGAEDDGKAVYYNGFYHICGTMLSGTDCWAAKGEGPDDGYIIDDDRTISLNDSFSVGFTYDVSEPEDDLPGPVLQMEVFIGHFPWVLDKPNSFLE